MQVPTRPATVDQPLGEVTGVFTGQMAMAVGFEPTEGDPSSSFEISNRRVNPDRLRCSSRSTSRGDLQRSWVIVSECYQNCPQRGYHSQSAIPVEGT